MLELPIQFGELAKDSKFSQLSFQIMIDNHLDTYKIKVMSLDLLKSYKKIIQSFSIELMII